jgi:hypothetical protein
MKNAFLLAALLLLGRSASAQFYVYHVSGQAFVKKQGTVVPLRARDAVQPGQVLQLKPGAQVVLLDAEGRNISYAKPGTASYAALQQAFQASSVGTGRAYLAYVWQSMNHHAPAPAHQANAPLGGVARSGAPTAVPLAPADSAVLEQAVVPFQWEPKSPGATSWLTLTDATGDPLLQLSTATPALELNTVFTRLKPNTVYYWAVSDTREDAPSARRRAFVIADEEGLRLFAQELAGLPLGADAPRWQQQFRAAWFMARAGGR